MSGTSALAPGTSAPSREGDRWPVAVCAGAGRGWVGGCVVLRPWAERRGQTGAGVFPSTVRVHLFSGAGASPGGLRGWCWYPRRCHSRLCPMLADTGGNVCCMLCRERSTPYIIGLIRCVAVALACRLRQPGGG
eukprot:scaffold26980_cov140-Isochrysis_galbana.AAC.1